MATSPQSLRSPEELATYFLRRKNKAVQEDKAYILTSMAHRQRLVKGWGIPLGAKVLEIGCGQGDMTIVLADAVGPTGKITAVDPGPTDYGTPPLGEAHEFVLASPVGQQIEFVRADPVVFLKAFAEPEPFDYIVMSYCVYYFSRPEILPDMLSVARKHTKGAKLLMAEFALAASQISAVPHLLSALAVCALESFLDGSSQRNMHAVLAPAQMRGAAAAAGWVLRKDEVVPTDPAMRFGFHEARMALSPRLMFEKDVESLTVDSKIKSMLHMMHGALQASVAQVDGGLEAVTNMDSWVASFEPAEEK